jgi:hypothetical protein
MKKFVITLAALGALSGVALAERPGESSDRVDYAIGVNDNAKSYVQSNALAAEDSLELINQRREDEKNDASN